MTFDVVLVQHADKERVPRDAGLSPLGFQQADRLASHLAIDSWCRLLSSPMRRARETAAVIGQACELAVEIDARLRERMNWGDASFEQTLDQFLDDWSRATTERHWQPPSGDSSKTTAARVRSLLDEVTGADVGPTLLVTHGGATVDLLRDLLGDDALEVMAPGCLSDGITSCGLTRLAFDGDSWRVLSVGERRR